MPASSGCGAPKSAPRWKSHRGPGDSLSDNNPNAPVRSLAFRPDRQGLVTFLILDEQRRVDVLDVRWLS